jgi:hypothetical protein
VRTAIAVGTLFPFRDWFSVLNLYGSTKQVQMKIDDRKANNEAFPFEHVVRLPRRLGIDSYHCVSNIYIRPRHNPDGTLNRNVY